MSDPFVREDRYLVMKHSDLALLRGEDRQTLSLIAFRLAARRALQGKRTLECVVIENDWPEYEPAWAAIEARMNATSKEN